MIFSTESCLSQFLRPASSNGPLVLALENSNVFILDRLAKRIVVHCFDLRALRYQVAPFTVELRSDLVFELSRRRRRIPAGSGFRTT